MVKLGGRDISIDQGINIVFGAGAAAVGTAALVAPNKTKNQMVGGVVPTSASMSRLYGPAVIGMGAHSLLSGLDKGGTTNKDTLKINAAQLGLVCVSAANEWRNGGDIRSDRVKIVTVASGVLAAGLVYRATTAGSGGTAATV